MTANKAIWTACAVLFAVNVAILLVFFRTESAAFVMIAIGVFCAVSASIEFSLRGYTSRSGEKLDAIRFPPPTQGDQGLTRISVIVPAYRESAVIGETLRVLATQDYPADSYEVIVTLKDDGKDVDTMLETQYAISGLPNFTMLYEPYGDGSNKSSQMNRALRYATGDYIAVFDAEDLVSPQLFRSVDALIKKSGADMVQGGVQLMNLDIPSGLPKPLWLLAYLRRGWFAVHNVIEYWFWFPSRMFFQQEVGFVPLGGNTVIIEQSVLRAAGGWDESKLTEDADLGTRLCAKYGATLVAAYTPELATREQTPLSIRGLFKQRVRWDQGFWQVLRDGKWLRLPSLRQRIIAGYTLATPLIQAVSGLLLPIAVLGALFLKLPPFLTMALYLPVGILLLTMFAQMVELRSFGKAFGVPVRPRHYVSLLIGYFPYQILLGVAAIASVIREARGINSWSLTRHAPAQVVGNDPVLSATVKENA